MASMTVDRRFFSALGRFSSAQSAPVVPPWTAIFLLASLRESAVSVEPALTTMDWLEST